MTREGTHPTAASYILQCKRYHFYDCAAVVLSNFIKNEDIQKVPEGPSTMDLYSRSLMLRPQLWQGCGRTGTWE